MTSADKHVENITELEDYYVDMTGHVIHESRRVENNIERWEKLRELMSVMIVPGGFRERINFMIGDAKYDYATLKWTIRVLIAVKTKLIHSYFDKNLRGAYLSPELLEIAENFEYKPEKVGVWAHLNFEDELQKRRQNQNLKELLAMRKDYHADFRKVFGREKAFRARLDTLVEMRNNIVSVGCPSLNENLVEVDQKLKRVYKSLHMILAKKEALEGEADIQLNDYCTDSVEEGDMTPEIQELVDRPFTPANVIEEESPEDRDRKADFIKHLKELIKYETITNQRCDHLRSLARRDRDLMEAEKKSRNNQFGPPREFDIVKSYQELIDERWSDVRLLMSEIHKKRRAFATEYITEEQLDDFVRRVNLPLFLEEHEQGIKSVNSMEVDCDKELDEMTDYEESDDDSSMKDGSEESDDDSSMSDGSDKSEVSTVTLSEVDEDEERDDCSGEEVESEMSEYGNDCAMEID